LDLPPGRILARLDAFAQHLGHTQLATCLYCVYDPTTGRSTLASAGHLPPVLVGPDGSNELLKVPVGAPIGVGGVTFDTLELLTDPGSLLLLCTDGLVETRGQDIEEALRALGHRLTTALGHRLTTQHSSLEDTCEALMRHQHPEGHHDDITVLMARLNGIP
jgi:serine phosphatase RsbU (regulator of sigma subunit)